MSENFEIKIEDKVSPAISTKLQNIERRAKTAHTAIERLSTALANLQPKGLERLEAAVTKGQAAIDRAAMAAQRLATEQQKTARAAALAEAAQNRLAQTSNKTAVASANLATAQQKAAAASMNAEAALNKAVTAETNAATAAQRLTAAQQGTVAATAQAGAAQANLATATARTATEQARGAQAAQRVATEQQRTATAAAQAAAAGDRAALAALRLAQAQDRAAAASQRSAAGVMTFVRSAVALAGVTLTAGAILTAADAYTVMSNKLQNVSESQEQVVTLQNRLFELANETRTSVSDVTTAYARFDAALQLVGASQEESLRITETVNKALKVGGATAGESASALLQLSQAFNKGKLDGDEFRSLMENMPVFVKKAIAEAAKVPISGIFDAARSGKLGIDQLREAFEKLGPEVDEKFARTVPTLSEALTVFRNKFTQAWGEINKSLGITSTLSELIIGLANNLDVLAVAVTAVGVAMTIYFGPNLVAMFGRASQAIKAFTLVMAANPIGLIAVAISTALVALIAFSDRIKLTADGAVTLRDGFVTAWLYIKDAAAMVADFVGTAWNKAIDWVNSVTDGWGEKFRDIGNVIMQVGKMVINLQIAGWVSAYRIIVAAWNNFPAAMEAFFVAIVNTGAKAIELLVNSWQGGLRLIAWAAESIAPEMSKSLTSALDSMKLELPRLEGSQQAKDFVSEAQGIMRDAFSTDYVGKGVDAFMIRARGVAAQRRREAALRGAGANQTGSGDGDGGKSAMKRAQALMLVNKQLDDELSRMFMLKPEREIQQKFDQIESELLRKKITLTAQEAEAIKDKLKAIEDAKYVQAEFDRIYEDAIGPMRTRNAVQEAANKLLSMGAITQDQYNRELVKAREAYNNATDPLYKHNRELQQQMDLLRMLPKQREIEQQLMQITNDLLSQGVELDKEQLRVWREKLQALQQLNELSQAQNAIYSASNAAKRNDLSNSVQAGAGLTNDPRSGVNASDVVGSMASAIPGLESTTAYFEYVKQGYTDMYAAIDELRQADILSDQDAMLAKFQTFQQQSQTYLSAASNIFGSLTALQSSENKKQAALGKRAAIAQTVIKTYESATSAFSAMAGIPYVGPFLGAAAAAAAIAAGMANVQAIKSQGFRDGGYTGNFPRNAEVGSVHGQEFVMNANATQRIGVNDLKALQMGAASVRRNGESTGVANSSGGNGAPVVVPAPNIRMINVSSEQEARNYANSDENEQVVLNILERNGLF